MQITIRLIDGELKTLRKTLEPLAEFFDLSGPEVYIGRRIAEFRPILNYLRGSVSDIPDSSGPAAAAVGLIEEHGCAVAINIGGTVFHVSAEYISQSTYFAGMLNWKKQNSKMRTLPPLVDLTDEFIDRDPADFAVVLAYLEGGSNPGSEVERDYYGIALRVDESDESDTHKIMPYPSYAGVDGTMGLMACDSSQKTKGNYIGTKIQHIDISNYGKTCILSRCLVDRSIDTIHRLAIEILVTHERKPTINECYELVDEIDILVGNRPMSKTTSTWLRIMKLIPIIVALGNNNYCIHIPLVSFFSPQQPFLLVATFIHSFVIEGRLNRLFNVEECNLIIEYELLNTDERRRAAANMIDCDCYTHLGQIVHSEGGKKTRIRLNLDGIPAGGLFLKCSTDFTDVKFICNGHSINYMTKATLISHSLRHFGELGEEIYGIQFGDMNMSRIDNFECELQHPAGGHTFEFYARVKNVVRYASGMCGMKYAFG